MEKYWFKPKRFWKFFAAYYPVSWQGWLISLILLTFLIKIFILIDLQSHSGSDTLIAFTPYLLITFIMFDWLCFKKGLYPFWWKNKRKLMRK
ncbi:MAG: hypothetical protein WAX37_02940 [Minisyncoccia bacterium]